MTEDRPSNDKPLADRHLWEIRACRDLFWVVVLITTVWVAYQIRAVLIPIIVAFALAYIVDPIIRYAQQRWHMPRFLSSLTLFVLVFIGLISFGAWLLPKGINQVAALVERGPVYYNAVADNLSLPPLDRTQFALPTRPVSQPADAQATLESLVTTTGRLFGLIGDVIGTTTYLIMAGVLSLVLFFYFSTRLDRVAGIRNYLPTSQRDTIWKQLLNVDRAFSGYIRGQFVVALFTFTGFCIGFSLTGVPYWFVVSLVGGVLSLIPYGQVAGPASAILLKFLESQTDTVEFTWVGVFVAPLIVYAITQSMETWVITPLVQGEATNLHPVTVLIVLVIGGAVGGILGLILAIPLTASARMLFDEVLKPKIQAWVTTH